MLINTGLYKNNIFQNAEATYNGVLCGFGNLSQMDIAGSLSFLSAYLVTKMNTNFMPLRALDCGAGIGRIAKEMLCNVFKTVNIVSCRSMQLINAKNTFKNQNKFSGVKISGISM